MATGDTKDVFGLFVLSGALKGRDIEIARLTAENDTLRARLETVEAETRERCVRELSLRRLALDHQTEVLDIAREMDIYDICIDAIRNMKPRHD